MAGWVQILAMSTYVQQIIGFITEHPGWTLIVIFLVSFGESFAFLGFLLPGTAIIVAAGSLMTSGAIPVWPLLIGAMAGATAGDFVSYWIGYTLSHTLEDHWPFATRRQLLANGRAFFRRYGDLSVFIGRFFGPMRALVPLIAGTLHMPVLRFSMANILSAIIWAPGLLFFGWLTAAATEPLRLAQEWDLAIAIGLLIFVGSIVAVAMRRWASHK